MELRNEPRNRVYPAGRHQQRLQRLLADQGFKIDVLDLVFMDANQFVFRSGPYWATRAIDPKGVPAADGERCVLKLSQRDGRPPKVIGPGFLPFWLVLALINAN
jgi:hypothetical protein